MVISQNVTIQEKKKLDKNYLGNKLYYNLQKISGENGIMFISTILSAPHIL